MRGGGINVPWRGRGAGVAGGELLAPPAASAARSLGAGRHLGPRRLGPAARRLAEQDRRLSAPRPLIFLRERRRQPPRSCCMTRPRESFRFLFCLISAKEHGQSAMVLFTVATWLNPCVGPAL